MFKYSYMEEKQNEKDRNARIIVMYFNTIANNILIYY
jgi:hypothetical protein